MGLGDVRYCFAMAILVIIITSPRLLFLIFKHFDRFHGNGSHYEKINP
jgi:hypothetical protein